MYDPYIVYVCRDWCISRQLWWGHQLPLYLATKGTTTQWVAASSLPLATKLAASHFQAEPDSVIQDPDVLDTWFSSALYPMSALGWPKQVQVHCASGCTVVQLS